MNRKLDFRKKLIFFVLWCTALVSCVPDPPHSNPLDPFYNREINLQISGRVSQKNNPYTPLDSCLLLLTPGNYFTFSDNAGNFVFDKLLPGSYQVVTYKSHYQTDTTTFHTDSLVSKPLFIYLNGLPFIKKLYFYSQFIDQWWPDPYYEIVLNLIADDPDGMNDIQEIRLNIPEFDLYESLRTSNRIDSFSISLQGNEFPDGNIFNIIGKNTFIELVDRSGSTQREGPFFIHRIIETSPTPLSPIGLALVNNQPILTWQEFSVPFNFQFEIQIFRIIAGIPNLIFYHKNIPSRQTEYQYPEILTAGQYFWVIWVRDEIGNLSRSKEASFQVQ